MAIDNATVSDHQCGKRRSPSSGDGERGAERQAEEGSGRSFLTASGVGQVRERAAQEQEGEREVDFLQHATAGSGAGAAAELGSRSIGRHPRKATDGPLPVIGPEAHIASQRRLYPEPSGPCPPPAYGEIPGGRRRGVGRRQRWSQTTGQPWPATREEEHVIEAKALTKRYGDKLAVDEPELRGPAGHRHRVPRARTARGSRRRCA